MTAPMSNILITGAGRGIGLEFARRFADDGAHVHATVRDLAKADGLRALGASATIHTCDVTSDAHVGALADLLGDTPIDVLVNNAGILRGRNESLDTLDVADLEETLRVNTVAPVRVTQALAGNVARSQRKLIVNISSRMGSISEASGNNYSYRTSKAALNMAMKILSNDLKGRGVTAIVVHPGWVQTDMGGPSASLTVGQSVDGLMKVIDKVGLRDTGSFINHDGSRIPW